MAFLLVFLKPLAYVSLPIILLRSLAEVSPTTRYYLRSAAYAGTMATVASCSILIAAVYGALGKRSDAQNAVAQFFYATASRLLNVQVDIVDGAELLDTRPAMLMGNHQSMLDILILGRVFPKQASIVSKESLRYTPLGPFMTLAGAIFVDRGNSERARRSLDAASDLIKKNKMSIWMFPEGTRNLRKEPVMLPLKKGGFHLAINAGIPIIPVVAQNYYDMYHPGTFAEGTIKVKVLQPIPTLGMTAANVNELAVLTRERMEAALREMAGPSAVAIEEKPASVQEKPAPAPQAKPSPPSTFSPAPSAFSEISEVSSSASIASSDVSAPRKRSDSNGAETEEDEGMVLVGRPAQA